jgi:hypothetical protein
MAREIQLFAVLIALVVAVWLLGVLVAIPVFVFFYFRSLCSSSLMAALGHSVAVGGMTYGVFEFGMGLVFPPGLLFGG